MTGGARVSSQAKDLSPIQAGHVQLRCDFGAEDRDMYESLPIQSCPSAAILLAGRAQKLACGEQICSGAGPFSL